MSKLDYGHLLPFSYLALKPGDAWFTLSLIYFKCLYLNFFRKKANPMAYLFVCFWKAWIKLARLLRLNCSIVHSAAVWASRTWLIKWSHRQIHLLYKFSSSLSAVPLNCGDVYDFISTLKLNLILPSLKVSVRSWNMSQYNCPSGSLYGVYLQPWHTGCLCSYTDSCWMKTDCPIAKQNSTKSWNLR